MVKIITFLLLFSSFQSVAFDGISQTRVTLSLSDVNLKKAFKEFERQTTFKLVYNDDVLPLELRININAVNRPVEDVLKEMLEGTSLTYRFLGKNLIVISERESPAGKNENFAPPVTGWVQDPKGQPLEGVNIVEKGTGNGTTSKPDGSFSISVAGAASVLVFSYVGYEGREITVGSSSTLRVQLAPRLNPQEEVVVIGYGRQRRRDITGSVASVKGEELNKTPLATLDQKLQGQVAGVQVTQSSGNPGGGTTIRVRGQGTIGNNQPLFVIDGFPIVENTGFEVNPLSTINPEDIESIEVLKDASSTAIYGSRGSNGVVLITTKKGRAGKPKVEFSASTGMQQVAQTIPLLNAREMAELYVEARNNGWNDRVDLRPPNQTPEEYYNTPNANRGAFRIFDAFLDPTKYGEGTNWQQEMFRTAPISNYQLNVSGGSDKVRYLFGGGYFDQQGIIVNSGFKRYAFRANIDADVSNHVKVGMNLAPTYVASDFVQAQGHFNNAGSISAALTMSPIIPVYNSDGSYGHQMGRSDMNLATVFNPVALIREATRIRNSGRMLGNAYVDVKLASGLKFRSSLGVDYTSDRGRNFLSSQWGTAAPPPTNPTANSFAAQSVSWLNENTLTYQKRKGAHNIDAIAGFTAQKYNTERISNGRTILPNDLIPYVVGPADQGQTTAEGFSLLSYLARVNYSLHDRYLLTATLRRDGSSRFGPSNRWGSFPSAALGWMVSQEKFMQKQRIFNELKLRASYGVTGNYEIGNYAYMALMNPGQYVGGTGLGSFTSVFNVASIANPDLTWETSYKWNFGVDMSFVNNRIRVTADYYNNLTKDMLLNVSIPSSSGFTSALQNLGQVENKGWELALNTQNTVKAFKWSTSFNISANQNKVLDLGGIWHPHFWRYQRWHFRAHCYPAGISNGTVLRASMGRNIQKPGRGRSIRQQEWTADSAFCQRWRCEMARCK